MSVRSWLALLGALAVLAPSARAGADEPATTEGLDGGPPRTAGGRLRYTLEDIEIRGNGRTGARVVLRHVPFHPGDVLDVGDPEIELARYRLLGTGFFSSVRLSLRRGSRRGAAVLVIEVVERNTLVVQNLWFGIAADEDTAGNARPLSGFLGLEVAETNLAGTGIALGAGVALAAQQLALRAHVEDPSFAGTGWSALFSLVYADAQDFFGTRSVLWESPQLGSAQSSDYAIVAYKRYGATLGTGHPLGLFSQLGLEYHLEQIDAIVPTQASQLRGTVREPIDFSINPGKSMLSTLRASLTYDSRDLPFLPRRGTLASAAITAGVPPLGSAYGYARVELGAQRWWELPWRHVIRASVFVGGIAGSAPVLREVLHRRLHRPHPRPRPRPHARPASAAQPARDRHRGGALRGLRRQDRPGVPRAHLHRQARASTASTPSSARGCGAWRRRAISPLRRRGTPASSASPSISPTTSASASTRRWAARPSPSPTCSA